LGYGFNEKVYENSLAIELRKAGLHVTQQQEIDVFYDRQLVGNYFADIVVNEVVMLELKAVKHPLEEHEAQLLNYLKATRIEVGLLLNFGPTASVKRFVFDNQRKGSMDWTRWKKQD
jgi:GxxExxY protein